MEACPPNVFVANTKIKDGRLSAVVSVDGGRIYPVCIRRRGAVL